LIIAVKRLFFNCHVKFNFFQQFISVAKAKRQLQVFYVAKAKRQLQVFYVAKAKRQLQVSFKIYIYFIIWLKEELLLY